MPPEHFSVDSQVSSSWDQTIARFKPYLSKRSGQCGSSECGYNERICCCILYFPDELRHGDGTATVLAELIQWCMHLHRRSEDLDTKYTHAIHGRHAEQGS